VSSVLFLLCALCPCDDRLLRRSIVIPVASQGGRIWVRFSAQIYNTRNEYLTLLDVVDDIIARKEYETDATANSTAPIFTPIDYKGVLVGSGGGGGAAGDK
jgi:hypothetical protein